MTYRDFITYFHGTLICYMASDNYIEHRIAKWKCCMQYDGWRRNVNAGGTCHHPSELSLNYAASHVALAIDVELVALSVCLSVCWIQP